MLLAGVGSAPQQWDLVTVSYDVGLVDGWTHWKLCLRDPVVVEARLHIKFESR